MGEVVFVRPVSGVGDTEEMNVGGGVGRQCRGQDEQQEAQGGGHEGGPEKHVGGTTERRQSQGTAIRLSKKGPYADPVFPTRSPLDCLTPIGVSREERWESRDTRPRTESSMTLTAACRPAQKFYLGHRRKSPGFSSVSVAASSGGARDPRPAMERSRPRAGPAPSRSRSMPRDAAGR